VNRREQREQSRRVGEFAHKNRISRVQVSALARNVHGRQPDAGITPRLPADDGDDFRDVNFPQLARRYTRAEYSRGGIS